MTLKLQALSYRRGFLRLYAVLAIAWFVAVVLVLPSHRLKFWIAPIDDSYATRVKESKAIASLPAGNILQHTIEWTKQHQLEEQVLDAEIKKYGGTVQPPIDYDALAEQARHGLPADFASRKEDYASLGKRVKAHYPGAYDDLDDADLGVRTAAKYPNALDPGPWQDYFRPQSPGKPSDLRIVESKPFPPATEPYDWFAAHASDAGKPGFAQSRTGKSLWLLGVLIGPPLAGYLGLFGILPWIYRGFKPAHHV